MKIFDKLQIKLFLVPRLMYFSKEFTKEMALVPAKQGIKAFLFYERYLKTIGNILLHNTVDLLRNVSYNTYCNIVNIV
jgi:hypothetical protein